MQSPWIFSCNTGMFDINKHFESNDTVVWKSRSAKKGDIVYIYLSTPTREIRYRCHVVEEDIPDIEMSKYKYAVVSKCTIKHPRYVKLALDKKFALGEIKREDLRENGINQFQTQARICNKAKAYFLKKDSELKKIWKDN